MGKSVDGLTPVLRQIISLVGRRADDPELVEFVTGTLGKKVPTTMGDVSGGKNVVAKKQGLEFAFSHDIKNEKYPLLNKSKKSFITYLQVVWLNKSFPEPLPFGLQFDMSVEELTGILGTPGQRGFRPPTPCWKRMLDPARAVVLSVDPSSITTQVDEARELSSRHHPATWPLGDCFWRGPSVATCSTNRASLATRPSSQPSESASERVANWCRLHCRADSGTSI